MVSTVARVVGSSTLHLETQTHMCVMVECTCSTLFEGCSGLLPTMKKQLSNCKRGQRKNFGYASILVVFFFERVPALSPTIPLPLISPRQPRITIWGDIFLHQGGGGGVKSGYDDDFYSWWSR